MSTSFLSLPAASQAAAIHHLREARARFDAAERAYSAVLIRLKLAAYGGSVAGLPSQEELERANYDFHIERGALQFAIESVTGAQS